MKVVENRGEEAAIRISTTERLRFVNCELPLLPPIVTSQTVIPNAVRNLLNINTVQYKNELCIKIRGTPRRGARMVELIRG